MTSQSHNKVLSKEKQVEAGKKEERM